MAVIKDRIAQMESLIDFLSTFGELDPPQPQVGRFYLTINDSVVFVFQEEDDFPFHTEDVIELDDTSVKYHAIVLRGGHGVDHAHGARPGEQLLLDRRGFYAIDGLHPELVMSLKKQLPIDLDEF
jgi:hypothetical protein